MLICYMILSNSFENTQATSASKLQYHNYPNLSADMPMLWGSHCAFSIPLPDCSLGSLFISKFKIAKTNMIICVNSFIFEYSHSYVWWYPTSYTPPHRCSIPNACTHEAGLLWMAPVWSSSVWINRLWHLHEMSFEYSDLIIGRNMFLGSQLGVSN